jgi:hypothetical protein
VLSTSFTGTVRRRRLIVGSAGVFAAIMVCLQLATAPGTAVRVTLPLPLLVLTPVALVLALTALSQVRPAVFTVDSRTAAFRTPPHAAHVYTAVGVIFAGAGEVSFRLALPVARPDSAVNDLAWQLLNGCFTVTTAVIVVAGARLVVSAWRSVGGVRLEPAALVDKSPLGTLIVPWEALAPTYPYPSAPTEKHLVLTYARPELVRRRGLRFSRRRINTDNIDTVFLGYAIAYYVAYPQMRSTIGTMAGYAELLRGHRPGRPSVNGPAVTSAGHRRPGPRGPG